VNGRKKLTTTQIFLGILVILVTLFSISGLIKFTGYLTTVERITLLDYLKGIFLFFILSINHKEYSLFYKGEMNLCIFKKINKLNNRIQLVF
jgi:hypothetical protein